MMDIMKVIPILVLWVGLLAEYCHSRPLAGPPREMTVGGHVGSNVVAPSGTSSHQGTLKSGAGYTKRPTNTDGLKSNMVQTNSTNDDITVISSTDTNQKMVQGKRLREIRPGREMSALLSIIAQMREKRSSPLDDWQNLTRTRDNTELTDNPPDDKDILPRTIWTTSHMASPWTEIVEGTTTVRSPRETSAHIVLDETSLPETSSDLNVGNENVEGRVGDIAETIRDAIVPDTSVSWITSDSSQWRTGKNVERIGHIVENPLKTAIAEVFRSGQAVGVDKKTEGRVGDVQGTTRDSIRWIPSNKDIKGRPTPFTESTSETEMHRSGISSRWKTKSGMTRGVPVVTTSITVFTGASVSEIELDNASQRSFPNSTSFIDFSEMKLNESTNSTMDFNLTEADLIFIEDLYSGVIGMRTYATPITAGVGVTGNVLSLLVMTRKHNRENSTCFLMAVLSVVDLLTNVALLPLQWLPTAMAPHLLTNTYCSIACLILNTLSTSSIVVLTYMTAQRVTCVYRPLEAKAILCNIKCTRRTVFGLLLFVAVWFLPMAFSMVKKEPTGHNWDTIFCESKYRHGMLFKIYMAAETVLFSLVPFGIILGSNIAILVKMNAAAKKRARLQQTTETNESSRTTMLLLVSFAFLILVVPLRVICLVNMGVRRGPTTAVTKAKLDLAMAVGFQLLFFNNSVNFYLYIIGGGKKFKADLKSLCTCGQKD
jgi:hypothetical protein